MALRPASSWRHFDNDSANLTTRFPSSPCSLSPLPSEKPGLLWSDLGGGGAPLACLFCLRGLPPTSFSCPLGCFPGPPLPTSSASLPPWGWGRTFCWMVLEKGQPSSQQRAASVGAEEGEPFQLTPKTLLPVASGPQALLEQVRLAARVWPCREI